MLLDLTWTIIAILISCMIKRYHLNGFFYFFNRYRYISTISRSIMGLSLFSLYPRYALYHLSLWILKIRREFLLLTWASLVYNPKSAKCWLIFCLWHLRLILTCGTILAHISVVLFLIWKTCISLQALLGLLGWEAYLLLFLYVLQILLQLLICFLEGIYLVFL